MSNKQSLVDKAYGEIRNKIIIGEYAPGKKITTQSLSDSLKMSRTPVVAAVNRLIAEGLVEAIPRCGVIVTGLSPKKIYEATEMRLMIELYCVEVAIKNIDVYPEIVAELGAIADEFQKMDFFDPAKAAKMEQRFHMLYVQMSGNERLTSTYKCNLNIDMIFYLYALADVDVMDIIASYRETKDIYEALISRDPKRLEMIIRKHLATIFATLDQYSKKCSESN